MSPLDSLSLARGALSEVEARRARLKAVASLELEPDADPDLPRVLVDERSADVRIRHRE
jgi:hypothetical protein